MTETCSASWLSTYRIKNMPVPGLFTPALIKNIPPGGGSSGIATSLSYLAHAESSTYQYTYTFTSMSFGTADTDRWIIVGVGSLYQNFHAGIDSVTVGGITATAISSFVHQDTGTNDIVVQFFAAKVPTGTSGTVVVNITSSGNTHYYCGVGLWRLIASDATNVLDTTADSDGGYIADISANTESGGCLAAIGFCRNSLSWTWSGATENYDIDIASGEYWTGATNTSTSAGTPSTVTATNADTTPSNLVAVSVSWGALN